MSREQFWGRGNAKNQNLALKKQANQAIYIRKTKNSHEKVAAPS